MNSQTRRFRCALALVATCAMIGGCNTTSGGGGGGTAEADDPLAEYTLGADAALDADILAITVADNDAFICIDEDPQFTEQQTLDGLKAGYTGAAADFPAFVEDTRTRVESRSETVCNTNLGDDVELDGLIGDLTTERNRGRQCRGEDPTLDDENSLRYAKFMWVTRGFSYDSLVEFTSVLVTDARQLADQECAEQ